VRNIYSIAALNVRVLCSDRSALFWLLVMPIAFTFVAGIAFSGGGGGDDAPVRYALTVANMDEGGRGEELLEAIVQSDEIDLLMVEGDGPDEEARLLIEDGDRSAALVIPRDYSEKLSAQDPVELTFHRNPERMNPLVTRQAVERVIAKLNAEELAERAIVDAHESVRGTPPPAKELELAQAIRAFVSEELERPSMTVAVERLGRSARSEMPDMGFQHSSPAMALMFILLNGLMLSSMLVTERREKTLARLLTAPVRRSEIVIANLAWRFVVGTLQLWFLIGFGALAFGVEGVRRSRRGPVGSDRKPVQELQAGRDPLAGSLTLDVRARRALVAARDHAQSLPDGRALHADRLGDGRDAQPDEPRLFAVRGHASGAGSSGIRRCVLGRGGRRVQV
jgi:ABC-type Na+ efflux pump permease subunit